MAKPNPTSNNKSSQDCVSCTIEPARPGKLLCGACQDLADLNKTGVSRVKKSSTNVVAAPSMLN